MGNETIPTVAVDGCEAASRAHVYLCQSPRGALVYVMCPANADSTESRIRLRASEHFGCKFETVLRRYVGTRVGGKR